MNDQPESWVITAIRSAVRITLPACRLECRSRNYSTVCVKKTGITHYFQNGRVLRSDPAHFALLPQGADYEAEIAEPGEAVLIDLDLPDVTPDIQCIPLLPDSNAFRTAAELAYCWTYRPPHYRSRCMAALYTILSAAGRPDRACVGREKYDLVQPAVRYLETHLSDPELRVESLAASCHLSVPYFRRLFRMIYSIPAAEYVERVRIRRAEAELRIPGTKVGRVAEAVGYRNVYHFSQVFKKATGTSPSAFIRSGPEHLWSGAKWPYRPSAEPDPDPENR